MFLDHLRNYSHLDELHGPFIISVITSVKHVAFELRFDLKRPN